MKRLILVVGIVVALLLVVSCEEKDSPLLFSVEHNATPENVRMEYYSPDPSCVSKMYWITANSCAGLISIRCTNANSLLIENQDGKTSEDFVSPEGKWKAEIVNSNTIVLTFEEIEDWPEDDPYSIYFLNVVSQTKKGALRTSISVTRLTNHTNPL